MDLRLRDRLPGLQEVEVAALVGLGDVLGVERAVTPLELRPRGPPLFAALVLRLVGADGGVLSGTVGVAQTTVSVGLAPVPSLEK